MPGRRVRKSQQPTEGGRVAESGSPSDLRDRFLQVAYDLSINEPVPFVGIDAVGEALGLESDPAEARRATSRVKQLAHYWGNKGFIRSQADGYGIFSLTPDGIDEIEGRNRPEGPGTTFNLYGNVQGSVIGTHNNAELTNTFDFRSIEQQIERGGGEDKEELRRALARVERLIERGGYLDRGALSEFSGAMERHSWFTSSVMQALLGFATQAAG